MRKGQTIEQRLPKPMTNYSKAKYSNTAKLEPTMNEQNAKSMENQMFLRSRPSRQAWMSMLEVPMVSPQV